MDMDPIYQRGELPRYLPDEVHAQWRFIELVEHDCLEVTS